CPHKGRQPLVSIKRTAISLAGSCGGYKILPLIMSCPRGSNINPFLIQSYSLRKCCLFSLMFFPFSTGPPLATSLTGLPHVCASMQENVCFIVNGLRKQLFPGQQLKNQGVRAWQ